MIGEYLSCKSELEDHVIHLLFSANRWEAMYACLIQFLAFVDILSKLISSPLQHLAVGRYGINLVYFLYQCEGIFS